MRRGNNLNIRSRCSGCGHVSSFPASPVPFDTPDGRDPCFALPLFLSEPVGDNLLWAYNRTHIDLLTAWLGAHLRERSLDAHNMTMMARLPRWMKVAAARAKIVHALDKLRDRAERGGLS